jgi:DNA-binding transcriptional LysR family regulator
MAEYQGQYKGGLAIGGSTIPGGYLLPKLIGRFNRDYPDIRISLQIGDSTDIVRKTLAGTIELGFVGALFPEPHLQETILTRDTLKLIVPAHHPWADRRSVPVEALRREPMIVREAGSGTLKVIKKAFADKGLSLSEQCRIIAEIGNTAGMVGGIKSGLGVAILSPRAIEEELRTGRLKALRIEGIDLCRYIYLAEDRRRSLSPLARAFRDYVVQHFREGAPAEMPSNG